jgi:hypothetical protein
MAVFPSLRPRSRAFDFGDYPVTIETTGAGDVPFLHGPDSSGHIIKLTFIDLSQAEARQIRNHYLGQSSGHVPFPLSALAWAGHSDFNDLVPAGTFWCYVGKPRERQKNGGFIDVDVELEAVI